MVKLLRFRGQYRHTVDHKGRVAVPHPFRKALAPESNGLLVLTKGFDGEIEVRTVSEWEAFEENVLLSLAPNKRSYRRFRTRRLANAHEVALDGQGRVMIPQHLQEYAQIKDEVTITGAGTYFQIWNPEVFKKFEQEYDEHQEEDSENLDASLYTNRKGGSE